PASRGFLALRGSDLTSVRVGYDMTFPDRNTGGVGEYARRLLGELRSCEDIEMTRLAGHSRSGLRRTAWWLLAGARSATRRAVVGVVHCPAFVAPWRLDLPFVVTVHD